MVGEDFFDSPELQSIKKSKLVVDYFKAWANIMAPWAKGRDPRIAYVDLFSGPGNFDDGSDSTPLLILKHAINNRVLSDKLMATFNDKNVAYSRQLMKTIAELPGIETLKHRPQVSNLSVGRDLVELIQHAIVVPTLFFIDPWGYKGLSLSLLGTAIEGWGCDCIFFFNYNRINPALGNQLGISR